MEYQYLHTIQYACDLKALPKEALPRVCDELRDFIIQQLSQNPGHLGSSLGTVELTVALHYVFDTPNDQLVWDVGHQAYGHKILTGRRDRFKTNRKLNGLSGFPNPAESEYDAFGAGHSSTSLSAALGFAEANALSGSDAYTVAVVGDGAYTGGMIHEALNNCEKKLRLIIIINENEMSISKNIGKFAGSLAKLRQKSGYFKAKRFTASFIKKIPLVGKGLFRAAVRMKKSLKN